MVEAQEHSAAVEDYLKAIWQVEESGLRPTGRQVARRLDVTPASVTQMARRLDELGLVRYRPYQALELTERGRSAALEVVRHHRLLELFLSEALGMPWDRIHAEAEVLEHHISEELEELISSRLGNPRFDPHGHPIPGRDGTMPTAISRPLTSLGPGSRATIVQVGDDDPDALRRLSDAQLTVGTVLTVVSTNLRTGSVMVQLDDRQHAQEVGAELAARIEVGP